MQISVFAVGRMKKGLESDLATRYFSRFAKAAGSLGLSFAGIHEITESRAANATIRIAEESTKMLEYLDPGARLILLDERGKSLSSRDFTRQLELYRDDGVRQLVIALGGPDGHSDIARKRADMLLSFGTMTWPHQIARILISEQLYRATTILSGHPYHRD